MIPSTDMTWMMLTFYFIKIVFKKSIKGNFNHVPAPDVTSQVYQLQNSGDKFRVWPWYLVVRFFQIGLRLLQSSKYVTPVKD